MPLTNLLTALPIRTLNGKLIDHRHGLVKIQMEVSNGNLDISNLLERYSLKEIFIFFFFFFRCPQMVKR